MNRNTIIGLLLIGAIFIGWSYMMQPSEEELAKRQYTQDSLLAVQQQRNVTSTIIDHK
jgi:YidC/Oxa1 family membrane protein insertase